MAQPTSVLFATRCTILLCPQPIARRPRGARSPARRGARSPAATAAPSTCAAVPLRRDSGTHDASLARIERPRPRRRRRRRPRGHRFFPGASFPWLGPEHLDLRLDIDEVAAAGSSLASGLVVLDDTVCPIRVAARLVRFFADESCGKCTPCREGTSWLDKIMYRIVHGYGRLEDLALLQDVGSRMGPGTTICALGPSAVAPISSTLDALPRSLPRAHPRGGCPLETPARAA